MDLENTLLEQQTLKTCDQNPCAKIFQCGLCSVTFDLNHELVSHVDNHNLPRPFQCGVCKESYITNPELISHVTVHNVFIFIPVIPSKGVLTPNVLDTPGLGSAASVACTQGIARAAETGTKDGGQIHSESMALTKSPKQDLEMPFDDYVSGNVIRSISEVLLSLSDVGSIQSSQKAVKRTWNDSQGTSIEDQESSYLGLEEFEAKGAVGYSAETRRGHKEDVNNSTLLTEKKQNIKTNCRKNKKTGASGKRSTKSFQCQVCTKIFKRQSEYLAHKEIVDCNLVATTIDGVEYKLDVGDRVFPRQCSDCTHVLKNFSSLKRHMKEVHFNIRKHVCSVCNKSFYRQNELREHAFIHTDTRPYSCELCHKSFHFRQAYYSHKKRQTCMKEVPAADSKEFTTVEGTFPGHCRECGKVFTNRHYLKKHVQEVHQKVKRHVCEFCGKGFSRLNDMKMHMNHHKKMKPFTCVSCHKTFFSRQALRGHILRNRCLLSLAAQLDPNHDDQEYSTVEGTFPGQCRQCDRVLSSKTTLIKHVKEVHQKIKRHKCDICQRAFSRLNDMQAHIAMHAGTKPFQCEVCHMGFDSQIALKGHFQHIHGDKNFTCAVCNKHYSSADTLRKHAKTHASSDDDMYICDFCGASFKRRQCLTMHQKMKHKVTKTASYTGSALNLPKTVMDISGTDFHLVESPWLEPEYEREESDTNTSVKTDPGEDDLKVAFDVLQQGAVEVGAAQVGAVEAPVQYQVSLCDSSNQKVSIVYIQVPSDTTIV